MRKLFDIKGKLGVEDATVLQDAIVLIASMEAQLILNNVSIQGEECDMNEINDLLDRI
jgi:hypothetical protein